MSNEERLEAEFAGWCQCLDEVRASLVARAEGLQMGGDIKIMLAVDKIVEREKHGLTQDPPPEA